MGKIITSTDGKQYQIISEWKPIRYMNITHNHSLWDFGEETDNKKYRMIAYFDFYNRRYAISQFMRVEPPIAFYDRLGYMQVISGYDSLGGISPMLLQVNDGGNYMRLFKQVS